MSLKSIQAKYDEAKKDMNATIGTFAQQARAINLALQQYKGKLDNMHNAQLEFQKHIEECREDAKQLPAAGIVQLDEVKRLFLMATLPGHEPHAIKKEEIGNLVKHPSAQDPQFKAFIEKANSLNQRLGEYHNKMEAINNAGEEYANHVVKAQEAAKNLNTHGIVQFDQVKKLLILACEHPSDPKPINLSEIDNLEKAAQQQLDGSLTAMMNQYFEKCASSWPSEIKVGMTFKNGDQLIEIMSAQLKLPSTAIKGDKALYHKVKSVKHAYSGGVDATMDLETLTPKKGWKFVKT